MDGPTLPLWSYDRSEKRVFGLDSTHGFVIQNDTADAAVFGQYPGLGPDFLGGEHAPHGAQRRVPVKQLQVPGQLFNAIDFSPALDLHGYRSRIGVAAHQVNRADRGRVLPADQPPARAEQMNLRGEQLLQMGLDTVLDQARVDPEFVAGVVQHLLDRDAQFLAALAPHEPGAGRLLQPAWRGHPVERLITAAVG